MNVPRIYSTLPSSNSIRLLNLHAGVADEPLSCSLAVIDDYAAAPVYHALSYCWGDASDTTNLICNGLQLAVTTSLHTALRRLRKPTESIPVWADAICINQQDILERNQQIAIMRQIYVRASSIFVWVGSDDEHSPRVLELISRIAFGCLKEVYGPCTSPSSLLAKFQNDTNRAQVIMSIMLADLNGLVFIPRKTWTGIVLFCQRSWFFRVWVIQEVRGCQNIWLICGEDSIQWDLVILAANWICHDRDRDGMVYWRRDEFIRHSGFQNACSMWEPSWSTHREAPFPALLCHFRHFRSTDPRDKVFALLEYPVTQIQRSNQAGPKTDRHFPTALGIKLSTHLNIRADYNMTVRDVYRDVVLKSVECYKNLEVLCYAWQTAHLDPSYPSWIPRWDKIVSMFTLVLPFLYDAAQGTQPRIQHDPNPSLLIVEGLNLGPISSINPVLKLGEGKSFGNHSNGAASRASMRSQLLAASMILARDQWQEGPNFELAPDRASNNIDQHFADFCAYLLPLLESRNCDIYIPVDGMFCNSCRTFIYNAREARLNLTTHYHCHICDGGDFDLCRNCFIQGRSCQHPSHTMKESVVTSFWCPYTDEIIHELRTCSGVGNGTRFGKACQYALIRRLFFRTSCGRNAIGPGLVEPGDILVVLFGARVPFILRKTGNHYRLIGDCYVQGLMDGEAIQMWKNGALKPEFFNLS